MNVITIIDLPRSQWRVQPPRRWQVLAAVAGIALSALAFGLIG